MMTEAPDEQRRQKRRRSSGRKPLLCTEDQILLLPGYYRAYRTQLALGADFGLGESRSSTLIREVEGLLLKDKRFHLLGKKTLLIDSGRQTAGDDDPVIVDVSERPVERPKKSSAGTIQGKKKRHTLKVQLVVRGGLILCVAGGKGRRHDLLVV